jgi:NADH-quinone oxidoreductase subunit L
MTLPLIILAVLSTFAGLLGLPEVFHCNNWITEYLTPVFVRGQHIITASHETEIYLMIIAFVAAVVAIVTAYRIFIQASIVPPDSDKGRNAFSLLAIQKFKVDELYNSIITKPLDAVSVGLKYIDTQIIDKVVDGVGVTVSAVSSVVRQLQTGNIGFYIFSMVLGVIAIIFWNVLK